MSDTNSPQDPSQAGAPPTVVPTPVNPSVPSESATESTTATTIENPYQAIDTNPQQPLPPQQKMGDQLGMRVLLPVGRSGWAIAAGYLGLLSVTLILAPLAIILSVIAIMDINKSRNTENKKHGMGRAIFGLIMGLAGTVGLYLFYVNGGL